MNDTGKKKGMLENLVAKIPPNFGRTNPEIHYWIFTPVLIGQLAWVARSGKVSPLAGIGMFATGAIAWTLMEYVLHRFSFHSKSEFALIKPFNSGLHLLHHEEPSSLLYVAAPIVMCAPVYSLTVMAFWLISGSIERALTVASGLVLSFLFYEFTHYTAHQRTPKTRLMKYLKKHHMRHHFGDEQTQFGVTSPLWDYIFGTSKPHPKRAAFRPQRPSSTSAAS